MRSIDLETLDIFCAVAQEGGIVRAAHRLHRVQSNVTTRIKQLEQRLGQQLLRKQGRGIVLTTEGEVLLSYALRLFRLADEAEAEVRTGRATGVLRIGSMESTAGSRLAPILSRFHELHPGVVVELVTGTTGALVRRVRQFELEAAFVAEPFPATGLHAKKAFDEELVLITSQQLRAVRRPADLHGMTLIAFADGCSYRTRLEEWLGGAKAMPTRTLEFSSYQAMVACVAAGTGYAVAPRSLLASLKSADDVCQHELPARIRRSRTQLVWHGEPSTALRLLQDVMGEARCSA